MKTNYANTGSYINRYQNFDNERKSFSVDYHAKTTASDFLIRAYYNQLDKNNDTFNKGKLSSFDRATYKTYVLEAKDTTRLSDAHRVTVGGEYRNLKYDGTRLGTSGRNPQTIVIGDISRTRSETEMTFHSLYVQDEWTPNDNWLIIPAVRYDYNDKYGDYTAPKIGVTYKFDDHLRIKSNYGKGFHAPSLTQLYIDASPMGSRGPHIIGNPDLKPEKSLNWDIGIEGESGKAFGSLSYFNNKVENLIDSEQSGSRKDPPWTSTYVNRAKATLQGVEAVAGYHFNDLWTIKGTWNYLSAWDDSENKRLTERARYYGTIQLMYDSPNPYGFSGVFWYEYANDYLYEDAEDTDILHNQNYNLFNISLTKKWGEKLSAFVGVDNIFNHDLPDIYIAGRTWRTGVEWKF